MEKKIGYEELFEGITLSLNEFDNFIFKYLSRKANEQLALEELDNKLSFLSNKILLLSLHLKQNYILSKKNTSRSSEEDIYYSKREISKMYKVEERTVSNWIKDGLDTVEIGGVIRINKNAIEKFCLVKKNKKNNWKSIKI